MNNKVLHIVFALSVLAISIFLPGCGRTKHEEPNVDPYFDVFIPDLGDQAFAYALEHGLNEEYCLLVDYAIPSGQPRVFLWSFSMKEIVFQAHTMHGPGGGSTREKAVLSNVSGSNCSPSGPFAITKERGIINPNGFFLRGLCLDNINARNRALMLHGAYLVDAVLQKQPEYLPIDAAWCAGCVTVSIEEMGYLHDLILSQQKLILLWAFCSNEVEEPEKT